MKIEPTRAWKIGDGTAYPDLSEAQKVALTEIMTDGAETLDPKVFASRLITNREDVVDILTMNENARPRTRKINGAKRKAKAAPAEPTPTPKQ